MIGRVLGLVAIAAGTAAAIWLAVAIWGEGGGDISWQGWLAMGLGIVATAALGGGLMALIFYSSRMGYDDRAGEAGIEPAGTEPPEDESGGPAS
jgi:hypothetical protein